MIAEVTLQQVLEALQRDIDSDGVAEIRQAELSIIAERLAEMERDAARLHAGDLHECTCGCSRLSCGQCGAEIIGPRDAAIAGSGE